jgi:Mg2+-importing ATPase
MIRIGLVSSVFDMLTFAVLLLVLRSTPAVFRTGWFIESIVTQTLVLLVIRTTGNPLRSRPSALLAATVGLTVVVGVAFPFTPLGSAMGFVAPPPAFLLFVVVATAAYLSAVEIAKRRLVPLLLR